MDIIMGSPFSHPSPMIQEHREFSIARFKSKVRSIIHCVRAMVLNGKEDLPDDLLSRLGLFTGGYRSVFVRFDEDCLFNAAIQGFSESTQIVLGHSGFTLDDLLSLPRLSNAQLSENSVYLDALECAPGEKYDWRLYVGSATSEYGSLKRWTSYWRKLCKTRHGKALEAPERRFDLRCIAHYGLNPDPWLLVLSEAVMMSYLGTNDDPGYKDNPNKGLRQHFAILIARTSNQARLGRFGSARAEARAPMAVDSALQRPHLPLGTLARQQNLRFLANPISSSNKMFTTTRFSYNESLTLYSINLWALGGS